MSSSSGRLCLRTTAPTAISGRDRIETDTNSVTGKSVVIRTDITIVGDLTPDGELAPTRSAASSTSARRRPRAS